MKQTRQIELLNRLGLHVRAATQLVKTAENFKSEIAIEREGFETANAKSIMSVITLAAPLGAQLTLTAEGCDAEAALDTLCTLIANRFGEDD